MLRSSSAALTSFLFFLAIHFAYFHFAIPNEKVKSLFLTAGLGCIVYIIFLKIFPNEEWFKRKLHLSFGVMNRLIYPAFGALFYGFLLMGYLEFYFTADRSITFRMLMIADKQPSNSITQEKMSEIYDVPGILEKRFEDLTYGGYFQRNENNYQVTNKGKIVLKIYQFTIENLHLGTGEFKDPKNR